MKKLKVILLAVLLCLTGFSVDAASKTAKGLAPADLIIVHLTGDGVKAVSKTVFYADFGATVISETFMSVETFGCSGLTVPQASYLLETDLNSMADVETTYYNAKGKQVGKMTERVFLTGEKVSVVEGIQSDVFESKAVAVAPIILTPGSQFINCFTGFSLERVYQLIKQ